MRQIMARCHCPAFKRWVLISDESKEFNNGTTQRTLSYGCGKVLISDNDTFYSCYGHNFGCLVTLGNHVYSLIYSFQGVPRMNFVVMFEQTTIPHFSFALVQLNISVIPGICLIPTM